MCRSTNIQGLYSSFNSDKDRLKVKSFFVTLTDFQAKKKLPESLTLLYLPRINETALEISGKYIRPDTPAYVTLHRVVVTEEEGGGGEVVIYGSRERAVVTEAVSFEVYLGEEKVLKGIYRKDEEGEWKLECKCVMESGMAVGDDVAKAEVYVGLDGWRHSAMIEKVEMLVKHKRRRTRRRRAFCNFELEEIPEERVGVDSDDCCGCCCSSRGKMMERRSSSGSDGEEDEEGEIDLDLDLEGVRWAVDVGIWVMCLGLGYFVSKAAFAPPKSLRRKTIF